MSDSFPTKDLLKPGLAVVIVEKYNQATDKESVGEIDRILTGSYSHPHGIKVMLTDGRVGRVKRIA